VNDPLIKDEACEVAGMSRGDPLIAAGADTLERPLAGYRRGGAVDSIEVGDVMGRPTRVRLKQATFSGYVLGRELYGSTLFQGAEAFYRGSTRRITPRSGRYRGGTPTIDASTTASEGEVLVSAYRCEADVTEWTLKFQEATAEAACVRAFRWAGHGKVVLRIRHLPRRRCGQKRFNGGGIATSTTTSQTAAILIEFRTLKGAMRWSRRFVAYVEPHLRSNRPLSLLIADCVAADRDQTSRDRSDNEFSSRPCSSSAAGRGAHCRCIFGSRPA